MHRIGLALMVIAWVPVVLACNAPGPASIRYGLFIAAHALNIGGFVLTAVSERVSGRGISTVRFAYVLVVEFALAILGPVLMGAASATWKG